MKSIADEARHSVRISMQRIIINEYGEQVITMYRSDRGALSDEEIKLLEKLDDFEDVYDEDCPPMSEEMAKQMKLDIEARTRGNWASRTAEM